MDNVRTFRRALAATAFARDQALSGLQSRAGEVLTLRDKLRSAMLAGTLDETVRELTPYEGVLILSSLLYAGWELSLSALDSVGPNGDGNFPDDEDELAATA